MNSKGVSSIDNEITNSASCPAASGITPAERAKVISRNPNSPPCARLSANSQRLEPLILNTSDRPSSTSAFSPISPSVSPRMVSGARANMVKLMPTPTVMKNRPSNNPLNGFRSASSWWRNSELASTTPATKVPSAGDRPTSIIRKAMPITISKEMKVDISGSRAAWTKRKIGRLR